jgi:rubrerythrin
MISPTEPTEALLRLTDLQRAQPADATLKNLLKVLGAKLELCASLPVFEWEARSEGYDDCAAAFRRLADSERETCAGVIDRLRDHLVERAASEGAAP